MMNPFNKTTLAIAVAMGSIVLANAATTLTSDSFEGNLGNWTAAGGASLYTFSSGTNYATTNNGAVRVETSYTEGKLTLTNSLKLATNGATSITIRLDYEWDKEDSTRFIFIDYSTDGGASWTSSKNQGWGFFTARSASGSFTQTLDESTVGAFNDNFKFRLRGKNGGNEVIAYVDNLVISSKNTPATATATPVAPAAPPTALLGLGGLTLTLQPSK